MAVRKDPSKVSLPARFKFAVTVLEALAQNASNVALRITMSMKASNSFPHCGSIFLMLRKWQRSHSKTVIFCPYDK